MGLFSKKPGGTFFGNLLRGVASQFTGGMLGSGANRIEIGQTKTNAQLAKEAGELQRYIDQTNAQVQAGQQLASTALGLSNPQSSSSITGAMNNGWLAIVGLLLTGIALVKFVLPKKWFK